MGSNRRHHPRTKRLLKLAHRTHPLSRIIRSITSKTKQRLLQQHHVTPRRERTYYRRGLHLVEVEHDFNNMVSLITKHRDGMETELTDYWNRECQPRK